MWREMQNQDCMSAAAMRAPRPRCDHYPDLRSIHDSHLLRHTKDLRLNLPSTWSDGQQSPGSSGSRAEFVHLIAQRSAKSTSRVIMVAARAPPPTTTPDVITNLTYTTQLEFIVALCVLNFTKQIYTSMTPLEPLGPKFLLHPLLQINNMTTH